MNKNKIYSSLLLVIMLFATVSPVSSKFISNLDFSKDDVLKTWTVMLYFCADSRNDQVSKTNLDNSGNFIHTGLYDVFTKLRLDILSTTEINVICLYDFPYSSSYPNGRAKVYEVIPNSMPVEKDDWGATNMGSEATLDNFISYCKTNYQASNYALLLSDHGRGYAGICFDYHAPHPYYESLGDCLLPFEIGGAIEDNGGVDILVLDSCLGSSFEILWEIMDCVDYFVAAETTQGPSALLHPREFLWHLSRNSSMTPDAFAQCIMNSAIEPGKVLDPSDKWSCATLCDVSEMTDYYTSPQFGSTNFEELYINFASAICDELLDNLTIGRELFFKLRTNGQINTHFSINSMMVGLWEFFDIIAKNPSNFTYTLIPEYAAELRNLITKGGDLVLDHSGWGLNGFNLCFPSTSDNCLGFLYPGQFMNFKISLETKWDYFLYLLFEDPVYEIWPVPGRDYMYFKIDGFDPTAHLHINFWFDPDDLPWHVGVNGGLPSSNDMGWEVGIEGARYFDDLMFGNTLIQIPMDSLPTSGYKENEKILEVLVNGQNAASSGRPLNLTIMHIVEGEIVWQENIFQPFELGQLLRCEVSSENYVTPLEPVDEAYIPTKEPTETENTGFESKQETISFMFFSSSFVLFARILLYNKRRKSPKMKNV